jgi:II/X family phage/plasmid replication protein
MYDTVVLFSPYLDDVVADKIESFCVRMEGIVIESDEKLYSFTRTDLEGSFDYRIRLNIIDYDWVRLTNVPTKIKSEKRYLRVECSLHKLLSGHNVYGGPERIHYAISYLVKFLEKSLSVLLPDYRVWTLDRIDYASVFNLGNIKTVIEFLENLKDLKYPRRKQPATYCGGVYFAGAVNTTKLYAKGLEFKNHDYKRILKYCKKNIDITYNPNGDRALHDWDKNLIKYYNYMSNAKNLLKLANGLLRIEVEIKKRKLEDLFGNNDDLKSVKNIDDKLFYKSVRSGVMVCRVNDDLLFDYYYETLTNLLNGVRVDNMVNNSKNVIARLNDLYSPLMAKTLFSTWSLLSMHGYDYCKDTMSCRTFYRHIKELRNSGCSWTNTDIKVKSIVIDNNPIEFFSYMVKNLCMNGESDEVKNKLDEIA